jgi:hypothetical protein
MGTLNWVLWWWRRGQLILIVWSKSHRHIPVEGVLPCLLDTVLESANDPVRDTEPRIAVEQTVAQYGLS